MENLNFHRLDFVFLASQDCLVKQQLTTQKADALLSGVVKQVDNVAFDVRLALHYIQDQIAVMPLASSGEILQDKDLPGLASIYMLDSIIAKVQVALDDCFTKAMVRLGRTTDFKCFHQTRKKKVPDKNTVLFKRDASYIWFSCALRLRQIHTRQWMSRKTCYRRRFSWLRLTSCTSGQDYFRWNFLQFALAELSVSH